MSINNKSRPTENHAGGQVRFNRVVKDHPSPTSSLRKSAPLHLPRGNRRQEFVPSVPNRHQKGEVSQAWPNHQKATLGRMQPGGKARRGAQLPALSLHRSNTTDAQESTGPSNPGPPQTKGVEHLPLRGRVAQHCHPGVSGDNAMTCQKRKARAERPERKRRANRERKPGKKGRGGQPVRKAVTIGSVTV